jgi:hypothetical protein
MKKSMFSKTPDGVAKVLILILSTTLPMGAQAPRIPTSGMQMPMPSVFPLFAESVEYSSVLNLVNELNKPLSAMIDVYSLKGESISQTTISLKPYSLERISMAQLLISSAIKCELGSIRLSADHTAGLLASLSLTRRGSPATYFDEEPLMPSSSEGSNVFRGVADDVSDRTAVVAMTSLSSEPQNVTLTCFPAEGKAQSRVFQLGANRTILARPCYDGTVDALFVNASDLEQRVQLANAANKSSAAMGIAVSSDGMPGSFAAYGVVPHWGRSEAFFTSINFSDPKTRQSSGSAYVGVPVGPSLLLSDGNYKPELAITNFGSRAAKVELISAVTSGGNPVRDTITKVELLAGATRVIDLSRMRRNGDLANSLLVQTDASPGQVMSKLVSRGGGLLPVVELLDKDLQNGDNAGGHPWDVANGTTSTLLLFNHESTPQKVNLRFGVPTGVWMKQYTLASMETLPIRINELIDGQEKDDSGNILPTGATSGEVGWQADSSLVTGRILQSNPVTGLARNFSCSQWVYACGFSLSPNPSLLLYLNNTGTLSELPNWAVYSGFHPPTSCSCTNSTGGNISIHDSWTTGNSSIANIISGGSTNTSSWSGAGAGSTTATFAGTTNFSSGGSLTCQNTEPAAVLVPASLRVVSKTVLPDGSGPPNGCPGSANYGLKIDIKYQVISQNGTDPIQSASMTPHEDGVLFTGSAFNNNIGPVTGYPTSSMNTAADGTFHDVPFGVCSNLPISDPGLTATQNITILWNGETYPVRSQTWTVTAPGTASFGHGKLVNNITKQGTGTDVDISR